MAQIVKIALPIDIPMNYSVTSATVVSDGSVSVTVTSTLTEDPPPPVVITGCILIGGRRPKHL